MPDAPGRDGGRERGWGGEKGGGEWGGGGGRRKGWGRGRGMIGRGQVRRDLYRHYGAILANQGTTCG